MIKTRLVLPVLAALAALALSPAAAVAEANSSEHGPGDPGAAESPRLRRSHAAADRRAEDERRTTRQQASPAIDDLGEYDRLQTRKVGRAPKANRSTSRRKSNPGWAKRPASSFEHYDGGELQRLRRRDPDDRHRSQPKNSSTSGSRGRTATRSKDASYEGVDYRGRARKTERRSAWSATSSSSPKTSRPSRKRSTPPKGESLADEDSFTSIASAGPDGSLADVFVDIGGLVEAVRRPIDPQTERVPDHAPASNPTKRPRWRAWCPAPTRSRSTSAATSAARSAGAAPAPSCSDRCPPARSPPSPRRLRQAASRKRSTASTHPGSPARSRRTS